MAYEYLTQHDSPHFTPANRVRAVFGRDRKVESITIHHWGKDGQRFDNIIGWFKNPAARTSAHYVVEAGRVACLVNVKDAAWHAGNKVGNATSIGLELRPEATDGDYATAAELIRKLRATYGDLPLIPHSDWRPTVCPGRWDLVRLDRMARGTAAQRPTYLLTGADELNVRTGPSTRHNILGTLPQEVVWTGTGRTKNGWIEGATPYMLRQGQTGWVSGAELSLAGREPKPAPAPSHRTSSATHNGLLIRYHVYNEDLPGKSGVAIFLHGDNPRSDTRDGTGAHIKAMASAARAAGWVLVVPISPKTTWWLADGQSSGMRVVAPQLQALRTFIPAVRTEVGLTKGGTVLMGHSGGAEAIAEHLARTDVSWMGGSLTAMLVGGGTPNAVYPIDTPAAFRDASRMTWAGSKKGDGIGATSQSGGTWSAWASAVRGEAAYRRAGYNTRLMDTNAPGHSAYDFGGLMAQLIKEAA